MQSNPEITVLMPVYNGAQYVVEAVESILQQTFTQFEFIIINDGSADTTLSILQSFKDERIRLVSRENKGLIDTLNEGLALAKGKYIARMDADDICLPERLQEQITFLEQHPEYVLVGAEADVIDKDGNYLYKLQPLGYSHEEIQAMINDRYPFIHPTVTFKKDVVLKLGGYPKNALTFEDHLLWKALLREGKVCNMRKVLLHFRFNPESVTIDERWRGKEFVAIRKRSIENGSVSEPDAIRLKEIITSQNFASYKQASYYAMVGKKYLWNNPNKVLARAHFSKAIKLYPKNKALYAYWLLSFLPSSWISKLYTTFKK